jgi:bacterioferritin-associated ferredoxin
VYICLCNALTDADVRGAASHGTRRPAEVFRLCGYAAQYGTCARTVRELLREEARPAPPASPPTE